MKKPLIVSLLAAAATVTVLAQDPAKVAPTKCQVAFENEYVRVLKWTENPGDKIPMHEHPALVSVALTASKTRFTAADGKAQEQDVKAGQTTWSDPTKHSSENVGTTQESVVQVELKKKMPAGAHTAMSAGDAVKVDPKHYKVEFENDMVRVLRIHYGANEKSVMHGHPASVAVYLTDGQATMTTPDGKATKETMKAGTVQWTAEGQHLPQNTGGKPFELVLVELK